MDWSNECFKKVKIVFDRFERLPRRQKIAVVILAFIAVISCAIFAVAELGGYGQNGPATSPNTLDLGLAGYWDMEEGGGQTVKDKSGNGNDGTLGSSSSADSADPVFVSGHDSSGENGTGLNFDGIDDRISIADQSSLKPEEMTIDLWFNASSWSNGESALPLISKRTNYSDGYFLFYYANTSSITFDFGDGSYRWDTGYNPPLNEWIHLVVTRSTTERKLYVNGQEYSSTAVAGSLVDEAGSLGIGYDPVNPYSFLGSIDEVRIYNRVLSDDEILLLYNQKKPMLEMKFDEGSGTTAYDESFDRYDASITGAIWTEGKNGAALSFDGVDDYVLTKRRVEKPNKYTISLWLDGDRSQGSGGLVVGAGGSYGRWGLYLEGSGSTIVSRNTNDAAYNDWSIETYDITKYPAGWHFITLTDDGTTRKFYRDGVFISQYTNSITNSGVEEYISVGQGGGAWASYFQGSLDGVRIYKYARTEDEILADYNDGMAAHFGKNNQDLNRGLAGYWDMEEGGGQTVKDKSGNGNDGTLGSSSSADPADPVFVSGHDSSGENGMGLNFDGADKHVRITDSPTLDVSTQMSAFVWVKGDSQPGYRPVIGQYDVPAAKRSWAIGAYGTSNEYLDILLSDDGTAPRTGHGKEYRSSNVIFDNEWHYVGFIFNAGSLKLYVDGQEIPATKISDGAITTIYNPALDMTIGCRLSNDSPVDFFNGSVDEARVYNRALSEDEIRQLYNQKKPVFEMKFDEGSGTAAHDESFNNNDGTISGAAWTAGKSGTALAFDSTSDYMAASGNNVNPTDAMTISVWVKGDPQFSNLVKKTDGTNGFILSAYKWSGSEDHGIKFTVYNGGVNNQSWSSRKTGYSSDWKNLTVTWTNGTVSFFYNGQALGTSTNTITQIGVASANIVVGGGFIGSVDDVRIYNYVRTADEILVDYNYGMAVRLGKNNQDLNYGLVGHWDMEEGGGQTVYDKSGNSHNGTLGASSSADPADPIFASGHDASGANGMGLSFDGIDDSVSVGALDFTADTSFTMQAWIKLPFAGNARGGAIVSGIGANSYGIDKGTYNILQFGVRDASIAAIAQTGALNYSQWYHIVGVYNAKSSVAVYVDGALASTADASGIGDFTSEAIKIGGNYVIAGDSAFFNGSIDEARVYNRALSEDEIRQLYNQKKPVFEMEFDEGSGTTAHDESFNNNDGTISGAAWTAGKSGNALNFDGTDDYVQVSHSTILEPGSVSVSAWVKLNSDGNRHIVAAKWTGYSLEVNSSGYPYFQISTGSGTVAAYSPKQMQFGVWQHLSGTFNNDTKKLKIFINGSEENSVTSSGSIVYGHNVMRISNTLYSSGAVNGSLDNFCIYNYARTAGEVLVDYNNGLAAHIR